MTGNMNKLRINQKITLYELIFLIPLQQNTNAKQTSEIQS